MSINNPRNPLKSSGSSSSGEPLDIYSTEERRIGTWIDGKPIYRKVFSGTTGGVNVKKAIYDLSNLNIETAVNLYGFVYRTDSFSAQVPFNSQQETWYIATFYEEVTKSISTIVSHSVFANKEIVGTIEYTKTADQIEG